MANNTDNPDVFVIESKRASHRRSKKSKEDDMLLESGGGHDWGERLSFTVGISYIAAAGIGVFKGFYEGIPKKFNLPKKLLINNFFNSVGKETCRFGNAAAGASLLYYMAGSTLNFLFEDELETMGPAQKNAICGAITGVIYKSTLGLIPSCVGGILGAGLVGSLTVLTRRLNDRNLIAFEMKF